MQLDIWQIRTGTSKFVEAGGQKTPSCIADKASELQIRHFTGIGQE